MLQFEFVVIIGVALWTFFYDRIPSKYQNITKAILCIFSIAFFVMSFIKVKIIFLLATFAVAILTYGLVRISKEEGLKKEFFVIYGMILFMVLFLNRGLHSRVYDAAHALSFVEKYNINYQLKYAKNNGISKKSDSYKIYIATIKESDDSQREKEIVEKLEKKAKYENYYIVKLYYEKKKLKAVGWAYNMPKSDEPNVKEVSGLIGKSVAKKGVSDSIEYIVKCIEGGEVNEDSYDSANENPNEDNGLGEEEEEVGVHWVNGYERQDGTEVDGYWRTNPDGDPTNNFSYDGNQ